MTDRLHFNSDIVCANCGQRGTVIWEELGLVGRSQDSERTLISLSSEFRVGVGETSFGDMPIICARCGQHLEE